MYNIAGSDRKKNTNEEIYLDYGALTPVDREVLRKMLPYYDSKYGNPSSLHKNGRVARLALEHAREEIAKIFNAQSEEIIFTASGTEADNLAIFGVARANREKGNHILISAIEHKAVLETVKYLAREGFRVEIVPVDRYGMVNVKKIISLIKKETILISVMYVNNELGTIEPVQKIAKALADWKKGRSMFFERSGDFFQGSEKNILLPFFHVDACQATNLLSLDVKKLGIDLMTVNSSKIYGPLGVACLYKKTGVKIESIIVGGEQEKNFRSGTENLPLIIGFAEALKKVDKLREKEYKRFRVLEKYFVKKLKAKIPDIIINGHPRRKIPSIVHVSVPSIEGESAILMLDQHNIRVSTGSACSASDLKPSHVLLAIGQNPDLVHGSIRFSMGRSTTKKDLDAVLKIFPEIIKKLKNISVLTLKNHAKKQKK